MMECRRFHAADDSDEPAAVLLVQVYHVSSEALLKSQPKQTTSLSRDLDY
jgi:hypothetical protein